MRILMISKAVVVGIYQRKLEEMARLPGVELTVMVPPAWEDKSGTLTLERSYTQGYKLLVEPTRFNGDFHTYHFPTLARRLRDIQPDIVHIDEEPYNFATWHSLWLARRVKAKALFFSWQNIYKKYPLPFAIGERYVIQHVDYALAGTESAAQVWRDKGYRGPMAVIPQFGVDPELFAPGRREDLPHPPAPSPSTERGSQTKQHGFVVGYVGRLVPEKGVDLLIRALATIEGNWRLNIIGQGPERDALEHLVNSLNLRDRVMFIGQMPSMQIVAFYRELDVLVIPSRTLANWKEQFGRVITEAMACGVPVIGSDSGAIPDIVGDAGLIFPEDDAAALRECLLSLMDNSTIRDDLARRGRERVLAKFTHRHIAEQTVDVYRKMLAKP